MVAPVDIAEFRAVVPGNPVAKGRPRAFATGGRVRMFLADGDRDWKATAQDYMTRAGAGFLATPDVPLAMTIRAFWPRPKSVKKSLGTLALLRTSRPDCDRVASAALDAAIGVWYGDDAQVVRLVVEKWVAAEGEGSRVEISLRSTSERAS